MNQKFYFVLTCILSFVSFSGCNSEIGSDCFKRQGDWVTQEISIANFSQIHIFQGIELVVKQSSEQTVQLTAGKNLINNIKFQVIDNQLKITNENGCEMLRNYHSAKVFVTTPVLEKIYSGSQYSVKSDGVLTFPRLDLESGTTKETPSSVFEMEIDNDFIWVNNNVYSVFKISGKTVKLEVHFWGGNGRFEGENLLATDVNVIHRGGNDIIVYPVNSVTGELRSTGNLVLKNVPPIIEVEQFYTGHIEVF